MVIPSIQQLLVRSRLILQFAQGFLQLVDGCLGLFTVQDFQRRLNVLLQLLALAQLQEMVVADADGLPDGLLQLFADIVNSFSLLS